MNITSIKGIGEKTAALFAKLNIYDTGDLISFFPKDYTYYAPVIPISEVKEGQVVSIHAKCATGAAMGRSKGVSVVSCRVEDETGAMGITYFNMPYIRSVLKAGSEHVFRGLVSKRGNTYILTQPKRFDYDTYQKISDTWQPIYGTVKGLSVNTIQKAVVKAYEYELGCGTEHDNSPLYDSLPKEILEKRKLIPYQQAVYTMHMPSDMETLVEARKRMVYQEFYEFILNIEIHRNKNYRINSYPMIEVAETNRLIEGLSYELTPDQKSVWEDIKNDMISDHGLLRLVQGDVGSGKTIIAILALLMCCANGYQGALMAPTEVLARQHFESIKELSERLKLPILPILLTGSIKGKARTEILDSISEGTCNLIIGTHALFQEQVQYKNLALAITDEQHRFGVLQRQALSQKGKEPNILIMSATPIPRTLAMILYGDLDVSSIHSMPACRKPIKNCVVDRSFRNKAYEFVTKEVKAGNKVYIVCPQVESGDLPGVENVVEYTATLKEKLDSDIRIEYLHGQMKPAQKEACMERFALGEIDVLVSTTVIEVGINVPDATLMFIENAERFGLAQLHQLRGRVGRSDKQSYCIFMMGESSDRARTRLHILEKSNDGFEIASEDMKLRGPGDIFGIRQSGEMSFVFGDIYQDSDLIMAAAEDVKDTLNK